MNNAIDTIRQHLNQEELLAQLAEEASELTHAALKLRRAYDGNNPTPVTAAQAYRQLQEELSDIYACITALGFDRPIDRRVIEDIAAEKLNRWAERLTE